MAEVVRVGLAVIGIGLALAGLGHAWLPRALGWTAATHRASGALSALVVRMHVYFLGLFLVVVGVLSVVVATTATSRTGQVCCLLLAVVFAVRAAVEVRYVGPVVRAGRPALRRLHAFACGVWPLVALVYLIAGVALAPGRG